MSQLSLRDLFLRKTDVVLVPGELSISIPVITLSSPCSCSASERAMSAVKMRCVSWRRPLLCNVGGCTMRVQ